MGEKIFYKTELVPVTIYDVMCDYFIVKNRPETYTDKKCTDLQCSRSRARSIDDLISIAKAFFDDANVKSVLRALLELYEMTKDGNKGLLCHKCNTIGRPVFLEYTTTGRILGLFYEYHRKYEEKSNSEYTMIELYHLAEGIILEKTKVEA